MTTPGNRHHARPATREHPPGKTPWWRRRLRRTALWVGGVLTAVLIGVLTPLAQRSLPEPAAGSPTAPPPPTAVITGEPVKVVALQLEQDETRVFAFAQKLDLGEAELEAISQAHQSETEPGLYERWAREHGGVDTSALNIKLVLEGNSEEPIRILGMRPIRQCQEPLTGTLLNSPSAGTDESIRIGLNLDESRPVARKLQMGEFTGNNYFADKTVSLKYKEQQTFQITATTGRQYCEFALEFTILDKGKTVTQKVANDLGQFRVSALISADWSEPGVYRSYKALYVGGVATRNQAFVRVDPKTYAGDWGSHAMILDHPGFRR